MTYKPIKSGQIDLDFFCFVIRVHQ